MKGNNISETYKHILIATRNNTTCKNNSDLIGKMKNIQRKYYYRLIIYYYLVKKNVHVCIK